MLMTLREAIASDASEIAALVNAAYRPSPQCGGWTHEGDLVAGNRTDYEQLLSILESESRLLILCHEQAIVACVHISQNNDLTADIGMLAIKPSIQAQGLGKRMLLHAEQFATERFGTKRFQLCVLSARPELIAFYERRGYQRIGEVEHYPSHAGIGQPLIDGLQVIKLTKPANALAED